MTIGQASKAALEHTQEKYRNPGSLRGISSGLQSLDRLLGGAAKGDLIIVGSRPGMGKTGLIVGMALHAAEIAGETVALFELEMKADQLGMRTLAIMTGITADAQGRGNVERDEWPSLIQASQRLEGMPLYLIARPSLPLTAVNRHARQIQRRRGLGMIIVDYLQLMGAPAAGRGERRQMDVAHNSRGLKALALELDVPVIACASVSREVEKRDDKRPMLADLREAGDIEQDADQVLFIYRHSEYLKGERPIKGAREGEEAYTNRIADWQTQRERAEGRADLIVGKNRHGRTGTVPVAFDGARTHFEDLLDTSQYRSTGNLL